ncbi:MAG: RNA methyltransferase [Bacilli bacterium]|nr:RNA methyltransferase [Bacilli bacterium]
MKEINSINNFRVVQWLKLKDKNNRNSQKLFMVEGYNLIQEAYKTNSLKEIITTEDNCEFDIPTFKVRKDIMKKISSLATPHKMIGVCYQKEAKKYGNNILLVDKIHHPGNLGTIIRSAVAFNVDTIVINDSVDVYNQKVIQATQGMIFHINIIKSSLIEFINKIKKDNYQIIGTDVREGISLDKFKPIKKHALLIGNEGNGLDDDILNKCDTKINIEMNKNCESLNVGVATGIILFYLK